MSEKPVNPFTVRCKVRPYELDSHGHVNNSVYINYVEFAATEHVEAIGIGKVWCAAAGGAWVIRKHDITYRQAAIYGDEVDVTTKAEAFKGATGTRRTTITRVSDSVILAECMTDWVWIKLPEGRPARVPAEIQTRLGFEV